MTWLVVVLFLAAAGLSAAGAATARQEIAEAPDETRARRAIVGLVLLAAAIGVAAIGGALIGAGRTGPAQVGAFAGAAAVVTLPLLVVVTVRVARRAGRLGRHGTSSDRAVWGRVDRSRSPGGGVSPGS